jgi:hypothetical protein
MGTASTHRRYCEYREGYSEYSQRVLGALTAAALRDEPRILRRERRQRRDELRVRRREVRVVRREGRRRRCTPVLGSRE